jgi:t-SNARE complex subunit (syntaxin)
MSFAAAKKKIQNEQQDILRIEQEMAEIIEVFFILTIFIFNVITQ